MVSTFLDENMQKEFSAIVESSGCELLEVERSSNVLRVFIDRPEDGVTLSDCETISRQLSALLDVLDFGTNKYVLEVSSPGLDRKLYHSKDYQKFRGNLIRVTHLSAPEKRRQTQVGRLIDFLPENGGAIVLHEEAKEQDHKILLSDIELARLEIEI